MAEAAKNLERSGLGSMIPQTASFSYLQLQTMFSELPL